MDNAMLKLFHYWTVANAFRAGKCDYNEFKDALGVLSDIELVETKPVVDELPEVDTILPDSIPEIDLDDMDIPVAQKFQRFDNFQKEMIQFDLISLNDVKDIVNKTTEAEMLEFVYNKFIDYYVELTLLKDISTQGYAKDSYDDVRAQLAKIMVDDSEEVEPEIESSDANVDVDATDYEVEPKAVELELDDYDVKSDANESLELGDIDA